MKRLLAVILFLIGGLLCGPAVIEAQQKNLDIVWTQVDPYPNDLKEWRLLSGTVPGGPYAPFVTIPYVVSQSQYTTTQIFNSPTGQSVQYFFVMDAADQSGNRSAYSNEKAVTIDFSAPNAPVIISITVK